MQPISQPRFADHLCRFLATATAPRFATGQWLKSLSEDDLYRLSSLIGLALEHFDGLGEYRALENGAPIDTSGDFDGINFKDSASLGKALHDSPIAASCLVSSMYRYAAGRSITNDENQWIAWLDKRFAKNAYQVPELLRAIATSDAFYRITPSKGEAPSTQVAGQTSKLAEDKS